MRGYVSAYAADTGKMVWRFYTVPGNPADGFENAAMQKAAETWRGEWWKYGGGGTAWDSMVYDPDLDLLYIGVGNGSPWNQELRSPGGGDNLFLASIVALNPDSGEYVWHYQTTPGDTWDYTAVQHIMLAELELDGKPRKVLMQAPKNGFLRDRPGQRRANLGGSLCISNHVGQPRGHENRPSGRDQECPGVRRQKCHPAQ